MGRPKKPPEKTKSKLLQIRLAESDYALLEAAAEKDQRPVSSWARLQLLKAAGHKG
jgi:hypothetical protein